MDCPSVFNSLIAQMNKWNMSTKCGTDNNSEKCHYKVRKSISLQTFNVHDKIKQICPLVLYSESNCWCTALLQVDAHSNLQASC